MARPATNISIPDTMMTAGSRAICSTRLGRRPRLRSVEAPSASKAGPTNAAIDFDAVALLTLGTPARLRAQSTLSPLGCTAVRTDCRKPEGDARGPTLSSRKAIGRPHIHSRPCQCTHIREQRVHLIGFVADLAQVFELKAQHHGTIWDQAQGGIGDKGFGVTRGQGEAIIRILHGERV